LFGVVGKLKKCCTKEEKKSLQKAIVVNVETERQKQCQKQMEKKRLKLKNKKMN
jgi:hypothetical protein